MEIEKIAYVCRKNECINCPLFGEEIDDCILKEVPSWWDVKEIERRLKYYGEEEN